MQHFILNYSHQHHWGLPGHGVQEVLEDPKITITKKGVLWEWLWNLEDFAVNLLYLDVRRYGALDKHSPLDFSHIF